MHLAECNTNAADAVCAIWTTPGVSIFCAGMSGITFAWLADQEQLHYSHLIVTIKAENTHLKIHVVLVSLVG